MRRNIFTIVISTWNAKNDEWILYLALLVVLQDENMEDKAE